MSAHNWTPITIWDDSQVCKHCGAEYFLHMEWFGAA